MGLRSTYASLLAMASAAAAQNCPLAFDGRVPAGSTPAFFDTDASPFSTGYVKGANVNFSQLVELPTVPPSLFDAADNSLAVEVTIDDKSIFTPTPDNVQVGFRRAELQIDSNNGTDASTTGIKTLHFSVRKDPARPLNTSHEYQLVFLEDASYSTNQFVLKTGTIDGQPAGQNPDLLVLVANVNVKPIVNLFNTTFTENVWHNFGLTLDFTANTTTVLYSTDSTPLSLVNGPVANDVSGQGQFHFGVLKKPTGSNLTDVTKQGFQPTGIDEGVVYGAIFMEDSTGGCVSLGPDGSKNTTSTPPATYQPNVGTPATTYRPSATTPPTNNDNNGDDDPEC
ncbi:hypothetical protein JHW43_008683 [Diplocarpon mali]|nr:hypothetical protein JHW43_008683 [Diplocarpon mali]